MIRSLISKGVVTLALAALASSGMAQTNDPYGVASALGQPTTGMAGMSTSLQNVPAVDTGPQLDGNVPEVVPARPDSPGYANNQKSEVFGANLFSGSFARQGATQFNPNYVVAVGDKILVHLWGAFEFNQILTVDPQGNIFIPHAGPVRVAGVHNQELQKLVEAAIGRTFRNNVFNYTSLAAAQPVRVYVGGFVNRPGLYNGTSMDSLLSYLDQAGGIDPDRGSFLRVEVKRGQQVRTAVNLYDFLLDGVMPLVQFADGDVIFVTPRLNTIKVSGLVANAKRFEFAAPSCTVADMIKMAKPDASANHVRIVRNTGDVQNVEYYPLTDAGRVQLGNGDGLEFTADKKPGTITVRVEGEHLSAQEYVLPYGTRMGELMSRIKFSDRSDANNPQLFRLSVQERQKQMLDASLKTLESAVLTARSGTAEEATLRTEESNMILKWVDRAKQIEPLGQVVISRSDQRNDLLLENGDVIRIPAKDGLVLIGGEVLFPNAIAYDARYSLDDYLKLAGGYTQNADTSRIIVAHRDGSFDEGGNADIVAGDQIMVLPKVDVKVREISKDITQMLYQIAVAAKVALGL